MPEEYRPIGEVLVPMDFSDCSLSALKYAMRIAAGSNARLHMLAVVDDPITIQQTTDQAIRDRQAEEMRGKIVKLVTPQEQEQFRTEIVIRFGTACNEIENYAAEQGIELIVMGNVGRSAVVDVLLGSVTAHVIRYASCPVLSVKLT